MRRHLSTLEGYGGEGAQVKRFANQGPESVGLEAPRACWHKILAAEDDMRARYAVLMENTTTLADFLVDVLIGNMEN